MSRLKSPPWLFCSLLLGAGSLLAQTGGRLFLFPSTVGQNVTVLDANTLASIGAIPAPANLSSVVGLPDGSKYYLIANNPTQTITVVSGSNLSVVRQMSLGANASNGVVTPDGRRLLVTAGSLRIFDTSNDQEIGNVPAGSGPTDIEVNQDSTRAFVMSAAGLVTVVNLTNNQLVAQYPVPGPVSMALQPNGVRVLLLHSDGTLRGINPNNGNEILKIDVPILIGRVLVTPDSNRVVILNRGFTPTVSSVVVDLTTREVRTIGTGGLQFDQIVITDDATAFGVVSFGGSISKIDLTTGSPTAQTYGASTRLLEVSSNGKNLYLVSFQNRSVTRVDIATNVQQANQTVSIPPTGASLFSPPASANAASMTLVGGDRQNVLAGQATPFPLSVRVTTTDGTPVFNHPVTFSTSATGVTFSPSQTVRTNSRGVAAVFVTVPAASSSLTPAPEGEVAAEAATADGGEEVNQFGTGVQVITVTASAPGTGGISFTLAVGTTTGVIAVSGSNQIARPNEKFPLPLVVRVTGTDGFPVVGASVQFISTTGQVFPPSQIATTDGEGIARIEVTGGTLPPSIFTTLTLVNASVVGAADLGTATFFLTVSLTTPSGIEILSGNSQEGDVGATLPQPLCVTIGGTGAFGTFGGIGVDFEVVEGPAGTASAILNPAQAVTGTNGVACTQVTIGSLASPPDIVIRAVVRTVANFIPAEGVRFQVRAKGGPPARIDIVQGNNQEGRPGQTLPLALRVRVFDRGGNRVNLVANTQFPLQFTVQPFGAAGISNFNQQPDGEASVLVTIALNYVGDFTVVATAGDGRAEFRFRSVSLPSAIVRVSGQDQSVAVGGTTAQPLIARVNDAQGSPVPGVAVTFRGPSTVTFVPAQGPSGNPITINTGTDGRASVSVRVNTGTAAGSISITAESSVGSVTFALNVTGRTPSFTAASIVNAASFVAGMVPGGLATLFGSGLSEISGLEFPGGATTHKGVQVRLGGQPMPLFLVRNEGGQEQINFQVRTDLPGPSTVTLEVSNNGTTFSIQNVPVLKAQPGIFEYTPQGSAVKYAAALKTDGTVIGPTNRVPRGGAFSIFLTALGPSLPLLPTGQAAPSSPLATSFFQPTVGVGGRGVRVLFSGLAPGFIGLFQINVQLGDDVPSGDAVSLDVIVEGVASQTSRIAVQ